MVYFTTTNSVRLAASLCVKCDRRPFTLTLTLTPVHPHPSHPHLPGPHPHLNPYPFLVLLSSPGPNLYSLHIPLLTTLSPDLYPDPLALSLTQAHAPHSPPTPSPDLQSNPLALSLTPCVL